MLSINDANQIVTRAKVDYRQGKIIAQLTKYLAVKSAKMDDFNSMLGCTLPFTSEYGLCSGLGAYWSYCKRLDQEPLKHFDTEADFFSTIEYILNWDEKAFRDSEQKEDPRFEHFLNIIVFLEHDMQLRYAESVKQDQINKSIHYVKPDAYPDIAPAEFAITFVFNDKTLSRLLKEIIHPNKMVRIDNGLHTINLMLTQGIYYLYNTEVSDVQEFNNTTKLARAIFAAEAATCKSKNYIALRITISDLDDFTHGKYPVVIDFYNALLSDKKYKQAALTHHNIFHLAARFEDYVVLDLLKQQGYKYIPWQLNDALEYKEAIYLNNEQEFDYLIKFGVPIDYKSKYGTTALGSAVLNNAPFYIAKLINAGANTLIQPMHKSSLISLAILHENTEALILLLAIGMPVTEKEQQQIQQTFGNDAVKIKKRAIAINKELFNVPDILDLDQATACEVIVYLQNKVLAHSLGDSLHEINLKVKQHNILLVDINALQAIAEFYNKNKALDMYDFPEEAEIYKLLQTFKMDFAQFNGASKILTMLNNIPKLITVKPITEYDKLDLIEIMKILDELTELSTNKFTFDFYKMQIAFKAAIAKYSIEKYLHKHGIKDLHEYLKNLNIFIGPTHTTLFFARPRHSEIQPLVYSVIAPKLKI